MGYCAIIIVRYVTQKPLKTILIEEIGSSPPVTRTPGVSKDANSAVRDMPSGDKRAPQESPVAKDTSSSTTTLTKKQLVSDSSTSVQITTAPLSSSSSIQDLPGVPSTSTMFIHDWKRLRGHPELLSKYFQVCNCWLVISMTQHLLVLPIQLIPLDKYSAILSQSLETDIFPGIINILLNYYVK